MTDDDKPGADDVSPDPEDGERAVDIEINLARVGEALTGWARVAVDRVLSGLALERWAIECKVRVRPADKFPPGHLRLDLRLVAQRRPQPGERVAARDKAMTEEHHAVANLVDVVVAAAPMVAGILQAALGELVDIVAPAMRRRLLADGALELPAPSCAGALCIGCGGALCPRTVDRRRR